MNGFETILPFLKPIEHLILDDSISEVMVNGADCVFFLPPATTTTATSTERTRKAATNLRGMSLFAATERYFLRRPTLGKTARFATLQAKVCATPLLRTSWT